jgi:hypothetical protein
MDIQPDFGNSYVELLFVGGLYNISLLFGGKCICYLMAFLSLISRVEIFFNATATALMNKSLVTD